MLNIRINPDPVIEHHPINDEFFAVVVDDFLLNPDEVVEFGKSQRDDFEMPERSYPGLVLDLDEMVAGDLKQFLRTRISKIFPFARSGIKTSFMLSMTTLQPEDFTWIQRLCHTDPRTESGRDNYAMLVYLFDNPELGGTGFYRYRDQNFLQSMVARQRDDPNGGLSIIETRYPMFREPAKYMTDSNEAAELITMLPAKYNRMVCYCGDIPHSAYIRDPSLLSGDCATGRLTLNCFASTWPKNR